MSIANYIGSDRETLDAAEAAHALGVKPGTLAVWRSTGRYSLPFVKIGSKVQYKRKDLETWIESRRRESGATK